MPDDLNERLRRMVAEKNCTIKSVVTDALEREFSKWMFLYRRLTCPDGVGGKAAYGSIRPSLEPVITTTWPIYT